MAGSNISRDHIAMEAMKVLLSKHSIKQQTILNRIGAYFGLCYPKVALHINTKVVSIMAYEMADDMISQREKIMEDKL